MNYKENADIIQSDGEKIGSVDRVVIDPKSKEITHIVAKKGILFRREKVLPVSLIESSNEERVVLKEGAPEPESLSDFEEKHHIPAPDVETQERDRYARPVMWYYPVVDYQWWGEASYPGYGASPYVATKITRNIPEGTTPLEEGAKVIDSNGNSVGKVEEVFTESAENRVTHMLITRGLVSKEKKLVPTLWIDRVLENIIKLAVDETTIDRIPEYAK